MSIYSIPAANFWPWSDAAFDCTMLDNDGKEDENLYHAAWLKTVEKTY
jgi:hypothetical protein